MPILACASAQSDQDLHCPLTESLDTTECMNGEQRTGYCFAHALDNLCTCYACSTAPFRPYTRKFTVLFQMSRLDEKLDQALVLLNVLVKSQSSRPKFVRSSSVQQDSESSRTKSVSPNET